jgi:hypothetical protein
MAYRNGTYVAFHANKTKQPTESDIKYLNLLRAWKVRSDDDFKFTDSHAKQAAVRDTSQRATLEASLKTRLRSSKNMVLVIGETTREDTDWVPFEIRYAIDECEIPIIAAYSGRSRIDSPGRLRYLWPRALEIRIDDDRARVIHIPFRQLPLTDAISQFSHAKHPKGGGLGSYSAEAYRSWGIV